MPEITLNLAANAPQLVPRTGGGGTFVVINLDSSGQSGADLHATDAPIADSKRSLIVVGAGSSKSVTTTGPLYVWSGRAGRASVSGDSVGTSGSVGRGLRLMHVGRRQAWPTRTHGAGQTNISFQFDPRLFGPCAGLAIAAANTRPSGTHPVGAPLAGEGGAASGAVAYRASLLIPIKVLKVSVLPADGASVVTVTNPDGSAAGLTANYYNLGATDGSGRYTPQGAYVLAFPYSTAIPAGSDNRTRRVASNTAATITLSTAFTAAQKPALNDECVLYRLKYFTWGGSTDPIVVAGNAIGPLSDVISGSFGPDMVPTAGTTKKYGPLILLNEQMGAAVQTGLIEPVTEMEGGLVGGQGVDANPMPLFANPGPCPCLVMGYADDSVRGTALVGDSITFGVNAETGGKGLRRGPIHRLAEEFGPVLNLGVPGAAAYLDAAAFALRAEAIVRSGVSRVVFADGRNDLGQGRTAVQILADHATMLGVLRAAGFAGPVHLATILPKTGDVAGIETERVAYNTAVKAGVSGFAACVDVARSFEAGENGTFIAQAAADTLHPDEVAISDRYRDISGEIFV